MDEKNILVAKTEFTKFLSYKLLPCLYQGIKHIWKTSKTSAPQGQVYAEFQKNLRQVKIWNQDVIENEHSRIVEKTKCKYLDDIIKKIFVLNTQILAASYGNDNRKIKVQVPPASKFLHHCYQECARCFYENVMLMDDRPQFISQMEQSQNLQKSYKIIINCIENTIRNMLPIEDLLQEDPEEDVEYSSPPRRASPPRQASPPPRQASPPPRHESPPPRQVSPPVSRSFDPVPPSDGPSNMFGGIYTSPEQIEKQNDNPTQNFLDLFRPKTPNIIDTLFENEEYPEKNEPESKQDDFEYKTVYFNRQRDPIRTSSPPIDNEVDFPKISEDYKEIDFLTSDKKSLFDEPIERANDILEQPTFNLPPPSLENHDAQHFFDDI